MIEVILGPSCLIPYFKGNAFNVYQLKMIIV